MSKMIVHFNGVLNTNDPAYFKKRKFIEKLKLNGRVSCNIKVSEDHKKAISSIQEMLKKSFKEAIDNNFNFSFQK